MNCLSRMWLLQLWKLTNPDTSLIYYANKERQESFDLGEEQGGS